MIPSSTKGVYPVVARIVRLDIRTYELTFYFEQEYAPKRRSYPALSDK